MLHSVRFACSNDGSASWPGTAIFSCTGMRAKKTSLQCTRTTLKTAKSSATAVLDGYVGTMDGWSSLDGYVGTMRYPCRSSLVGVRDKSRGVQRRHRTSPDATSIRSRCIASSMALAMLLVQSTQCLGSHICM